MPNSWPRYTVAELQAKGLLLVEDGNHGEYRPRTAEFGTGQWSFIRAADMDNGTVGFDSAERINDIAFKRIRKGVGKGGDVLFSHKGTVGKLAVVPLDAPPFVCSPQTTFWRTLDEARLSRHFLYYYMQSRAFTEQWMGRKGETDMADYVSLTAQRELFVSVPPPSEQKEIAETLRSLDDKIEQNRRTGAKLEGLARAVFKAWFVDFEPVKAKAAGATAFPGMPPETFAALPTRFTNSDLGPVPQGWRVQAASEVIQRLGVGKKFDQKTVRSSGKVPVLDQSTAGVIGYHDENAGVEASVENPVATFANHTCNMRLLHYPFSTIQNVLPFVGKGIDTLWAYFGLLGRQKFIEYKGHWPDFMILQLAVPTESEAKCFAETVRPLIKLIWSLERESGKLAALRDYLLPRLLSGRVRVEAVRD